MICFLCFAVLYFLIAIGVVTYTEHVLKEKEKNEDRLKAKALDRAINVTNFSNALIATILSSVALYHTDSQQRTDIYLQQPSAVAQWTIECVCAYIFVEFTFLFAASCRLSRRYWELTKRALLGSVIFHGVALLGLSSVLYFNTGYAIALWVVWSELTSVFLGIEVYMEDTLNIHTSPLLYRVVQMCTSVSFILQRVVMFLVLLWFCWKQFTWQPLFLSQLFILCVGTILNTWFGVERVLFE